MNQKRLQSATLLALSTDIKHNFMNTVFPFPQKSFVRIIRKVVICGQLMTRYLAVLPSIRPDIGNV